MRRKHTRDDFNEKETAVFALWEEGNFERLALTRAVEKVYGYDPRTASQHACRLLRSAKFRDVLEEVSISDLQSLTPAAVRLLGDIIERGEMNGAPVKADLVFKVIKEVLDRSHGTAVSRSRIEVEDVTDRRPEQIRQEIADMLKALPENDRKRLLDSTGVSQDVIDVESEPISIEPDAPWGRRYDTGEPRRKPGRPPKLRLPGPEAHRTPQDSMTVVERRLAAIKAKKLRDMKEEVFDDGH